MFFPAPVLFHLLLGKRFVTIRDEESVPGDSDDVFLAEEQSQSFQQQVAFVKTSSKRNNSYVCRCPRCPLKELIIFIHSPATTGLHCHQLDPSWNQFLSARMLLDRNVLHTPFWPGLLHILITLWPILLQSNSSGAGEQHQRSFSLPVAAKRKNSLVDLMRCLTPFTKHLTHILKSFVAYIFLSVLFTGTRERRECYFLQVLNLRSCQGKGKLLLAPFECSLPRLCVGEKAAFSILTFFAF